MEEKPISHIANLSLCHRNAFYWAKRAVSSGLSVWSSKCVRLIKYRSVPTRYRGQTSRRALSNKYQGRGPKNSTMTSSFLDHTSICWEDEFPLSETGFIRCVVKVFFICVPNILAFKFSSAPPCSYSFCSVTVAIPILTRTKIT